MKLAPLLAGLLLLLAGCTGSPAKTDSPLPTDSQTSESSGPAGPETPAPTPEVAVLTGRVHDPNNLSIVGARIDVLGTEAYTTSGQNGTYSLTGIPEGKHMVRVESGGFLPREVEAVAKEGKVTSLDIELRPNTAFAPGFTMHIHDYWGKDTTRQLMDDIVVVDDGTTSGGRYSFEDLAQHLAQADSSSSSGAAQPSPAYFERTNHAQPWEFFLPESPDGLPNTIWPGTAEVRFTASWDTSPENTMPRVGFGVIDATQQSAQIGTKTPGGGGERLGTVTNGGSISRMVTAANQTDNGHALFSSWKFYIWIDNDYSKAQSGGWTPVLALEGIRVKVEILKGSLELDPAHKDWWGGADTVAVGDWARNYRPYTAVPPLASDGTSGTSVVQILGGDVPVIPPGTEKLVVKFKWRLDQNIPHTYSLLYRTANQNPRDTALSDFKTPKLLEQGVTGQTGYKLYEITVTPAETDPFYTEKTAWAFKWVESSPTSPAGYYSGGFFLHLGFEITAHKAAGF